MKNEPATYRLADPDIFGSIVTQKLPPSPGAQAGVKGAAPQTEAAHAREAQLGRDSPGTADPDDRLRRRRARHSRRPRLGRHHGPSAVFVAGGASQARPPADLRAV